MQNFLKNFINLESSGSIILLIFTLLAIGLANSNWQQAYETFLHYSLFPFSHFSPKFIVNEILMTFFFLLVSLEVKRELLIGELNSFSKASLPVVGALGGMIIPAVIYFYINHSFPETIKGWAIPTATDIAFSLAILSLLGNKIPSALKIFLMALAIIDDIGAIIIIALVYTQQVQFTFLLLGFGGIIILLILNYLNFNKIFPYLFVGILIWICFFLANIHPTIAGVLIGFCIPLKSKNQSYSLLEKLEENLHPWITFAILPLFAFVNAGLAFSSIDQHSLLHPVTLGIFLGLFFGKQLGIFIPCWLGIKNNLLKMPMYTTWLQLYGVSLLCGIGFTMSLFIGTLAFSEAHLELVKLGVIFGSLCSAVAGFLILSFPAGNDKNS